MWDSILNWFINGFKKPDGSLVLSSVSIAIATMVFWFNKKMAYSKLSVSPSLELFNFESYTQQSLDQTYHLDEYSYVGNPPVIGLPIRNTQRIDRDQDSKPTIDPRFLNHNLCVTLTNKGELPSTNIKVVLLFRAYGTETRHLKNGNDEIDYALADRKLFSQKKIVIRASYIAPDDEKKYLLVSMKAQFRESELILCKIKANGHTYFREGRIARFFDRAIIHHYSHPYIENDFNLSDTNALMGWGQGTTNREWKDPYKRTGGWKWRRNWFAGWRK